MKISELPLELQLLHELSYRSSVPWDFLSKLERGNYRLVSGTRVGAKTWKALLYELRSKGLVEVAEPDLKWVRARGQKSLRCYKISKQGEALLKELGV